MKAVALPTWRKPLGADPVAYALPTAPLPLPPLAKPHEHLL